MSTKYEDGKKAGIEIQAKAAATATEKENRAFNGLKSMVEDFSEKQGAINTAAINHMEETDAKNLYGMEKSIDVGNLDSNERRVLINVLYTLSQQTVTEDQRIYFLDLSRFLEVFDYNTIYFSALKNINSKEDSFAVWYSICEFVFLADCKKPNVENYSELFDNFDYKSKIIDDFFEDIFNKFQTLKIEAIRDKYHKVFSSSQISEREDNTEDMPEKSGVLTDKEDYHLLKQLINDSINSKESDSSDFGKKISENERTVFFQKKGAKNDSAFNVKNDLITALNKTKLSVSPEAVISVTKISGGYMIFTTYALYLPGDKKYVEIPYSKIIVDKTVTSKGKHKNTRKLDIVYYDENGKEAIVSVDNGKVIEETLQKLLNSIVESGFEFAKTDKPVVFEDLDKEALKIFIALTVYILRQRDFGLSEAYKLSYELGVNTSWNEAVSMVNSEDDFNDAVEAFKSKIPYPSEKVISFVAMEKVLRIFAYTQWAFSENEKDATANLNTKEDRLIKRIFGDEVSDDDFNILIDNASLDLQVIIGAKSIKEISKTATAAATVLGGAGVSAGAYAATNALFWSTLWFNFLPGVGTIIQAALVGVGTTVVALTSYNKNKKELKKAIENSLSGYEEVVNTLIYLSLDGKDRILSGLYSAIQKHRNLLKTEDKDNSKSK